MHMPTERAELSNFCSALKCCGYFRVLKNFENVAETFLFQKFITMLQILQFVADMAEFL